MEVRFFVKLTSEYSDLLEDLTKEEHNLLHHLVCKHTDMHNIFTFNATIIRQYITDKKPKQKVNANSESVIRKVFSGLLNRKELIIKKIDDPIRHASQYMLSPDLIHRVKNNQLRNLSAMWTALDSKDIKAFTELKDLVSADIRKSYATRKVPKLETTASKIGIA